MTYYTWLQNYFQNRKSERLGQAFCNDFINGRTRFVAEAKCDNSDF